MPTNCNYNGHIMNKFWLIFFLVLSIVFSVATCVFLGLCFLGNQELVYLVLAIVFMLLTTASSILHNVLKTRSNKQTSMQNNA